MLEIRKLRKSEWPMLTGVFDKVFDVDMPDANHADIVGAFEDGKLQGFVLLERAVFIAEFYTRPGQNNGLVARKLVSFVRETIPDKQAVGAVVQEPRFQMLFKTLGLSEIPGKIFWRNAK